MVTLLYKESVVSRRKSGRFKIALMLLKIPPMI